MRRLITRMKFFYAIPPIESIKQVEAEINNFCSTHDVITIGQATYRNMSTGNDHLLFYVLYNPEDGDFDKGLESMLR